MALSRYLDELEESGINILVYRGVSWSSPVTWIVSCPWWMERSWRTSRTH